MRHQSHKDKGNLIRKILTNALKVLVQELFKETFYKTKKKFIVFYIFNKENVRDINYFMIYFSNY